ncbi:hypothetical protein ACNSOS_00680 [Aliarcobacter vitoriensis]|uniref:Uncharacterized protein n=1 Tax=Aliarcobacter vitoriensis TaxID=2011099 RepID=A0A366MWN7_9BACT|nr:hypothetical protein [Aliarcobacter vitoriensis]RBQ30014.1 hypothetical protein CRU91_01685 [Aliarcobacter vitoriensis]RBQ32018.1 hypothetical protein CRU92_04420 [Arcobacter sp. FW59]
MYKKYQIEINLAKEKLSTINFILEKDDDYKATFGDGSMWKIELNGKWYDNYCYISIRNELEKYEISAKKGVPLWMFMKIFGVETQNKTTQEKLDFIIEYKDKIFDDNFKYKQIFDDIKKRKGLE